MSNFMKIHLVGTDLIPAGRQVDKQTEIRTIGQTERRTGLTKLIFAFRNFVNTRKNLTFLAQATQQRADNVPAIKTDRRLCGLKGRNGLFHNVIRRSAYACK